MTEETINSMFSPYEWVETMCAHCCEHNSCVSMADVPTCYGCLEKYYDEDGEELPVNVYQPETKPAILWGLIALIAFVSIVVAPWLRD